LLVVAGFPVIAHAVPVGPGFSYQGQLVQNGNPVNGTANLQFTLWDSSGNQIGGAQVVANVPVSSGLFVVVLNDANQFGVTPFNGDARWLQVDVCTDATCSSFTTLLPRQPILATPYAQLAGPWRLNGGIVYLQTGKLGIGTSTPLAPLSLGPSNANSKLLLWDDGSGNGLGFGVGPNQLRLHLGLPANRFSFLDGPAGFELMTIQGSGKVGIGTSSPTRKLDVNGDIGLGPNGTFPAVRGEEEHLSILRGTVEPDGTPSSGCCFTVFKCGTGCYDITYARPFSEVPSVSLGPHSGIGGWWGLGIGPGPTVLGCRVVTWNMNQQPFDGGFDIIVVGPR
jgi:hypothetical protein